MVKEMSILRGVFPSASIKTDAYVVEGKIIMSASIENEGAILVKATRVFAAVPEDGLSANIVVRDALELLSLQPPCLETTDGETEESSTGLLGEQQEDLPSASEVPCEVLGLPKEPTQKGTMEDTAPQEKKARRGRKSKPTQESINKAREMSIEFRPEKVEAKDVPITLMKQQGVKLGAVMDTHPHLLRYLTQPGGRIYVTDEVTEAAEVLLRV